MVSSRDLAASYFLGTGSGLVVCLVGYFFIVDGPATPTSVGTFTALGFSGSLPYLGYWLWHSDLSDSEVWSVAQWCGLGIGLVTLVIVGSILAGLRSRLVLEFPHLVVNLIALGGILGSLTGLIGQLRHKNARVEHLNQRNMVLNRVLRHNVRNDVNVIIGYLDLIAAELDSDNADLIQPVRRKSKEIVEMSTAARHIQSIDGGNDGQPVELISIIESLVTSIRETDPHIEITTDTPAEVWTDVGPLLKAALDNLLENAVKHNDQQPQIHVAVESGPETVTIEVRDNGPGIPDEEIQALAGGPETQVTHGSGLGLWLVKWFVETHDGTLDFVQNHPRGTVVRIDLPAAQADTSAPTIDSTGDGGAQ